MLARLLGAVLILVPIGFGVWYFWYWIRKRERRDLIKERKEETKNA